MVNVLVTGSTGFLGNALVCELINRYEERNVFPVIRKSSTTKDEHNSVVVNDINSSTDWSDKLQEINTVIHCAACVHIMNNSSSPIDKFREVNTYGTLNLALQAADSGVKRFIFISSIKVNGESTVLNTPFRANDRISPEDPYGVSKAEAEMGLRKISREMGMEFVIIRPPLIYGPGVKANFAAMMKWVNKGVPLPLGGIRKNKRSLVSVENLVDLIVTCIDHPKAANETFLVSDDDDVSTTGLLKNMAVALNVKSRLIPIPASWFELSAKLIGKPAIAQRLCGSLQIDISRTKKSLNWNPPYASSECMKKTAYAFLKHLNK